jgi:hypothetical protein
LPLPAIFYVVKKLSFFKHKDIKPDVYLVFYIPRLTGAASTLSSRSNIGSSDISDAIRNAICSISSPSSPFPLTAVDTAVVLAFGAAGALGCDNGTESSSGLGGSSD